MKTKFLQLILLAASLQGAAQKAATVFGNLQIYNGASVTAVGDFSVTSTGNFINNGTLYAKANVNNSQASIVAGTGTLYLNGTTQQTIGGAAPFKTANLTTANSAGVLLNTDLSVSGVHTFTSGQIITAPSPAYLIYESGASYSGDNDARHVIGWVKKNGSADFIFPVGNAAAERTIQLSNLSTSSSFAVSYSRTTPNRTQLTAPLAAIDSSEYWSVNKISGGTATVVMNWDNTKVPFFNCNLADVRVAGYDGANWNSQGSGASGNVATTGSITSNVLSSFNLFTFGATFVLPLRLLNFNARRLPNYTAVSWEVTEEKDIAAYVVERSTNRLRYEEINRMTSRNSSNDERYTYADFTAPKSDAYYRLKWINADGSFAFSPVVKISGVTENDALVLQSNPVKDKLVLLSSSQLSGTFHYSIFSTSAQVVQSGSLKIEANGKSVLPLASSVAPGVYTLNLSDASHNFAIKFVVQ